MKDKMRNIDWVKVAIAISLAIFWIIAGVCIYKIVSDAAGAGYNRIEDTQNSTVVEITEKVSEVYPICPELLQAIVFYESSNKMSARSGKCIGYMQVSTKYHSARAESLGVSLSDGYGNILTGTDYLMELIEKHDDVATALMVYNGSSDAIERGESGNLTSYARNILELSEKLERYHGK